MLDYELVDFGNGLKQERFGGNLIIRPEKTATNTPETPTHLWKSDARCERSPSGGYIWHFENTFTRPWSVAYGSIRLELRATTSNNIGVFPEQAANWQWLSQTIKAPCRLLNLFGYTGGATLAAAQAGASVCHVDASKSTVGWARQNQSNSNLDKAPIRWIVDDALTFVVREQRRNSQYDALILDPPAFGRSSAGAFKFKKDIQNLLHECKKIMVDRPKFILLNCYATGLSSAEARNMLATVFPELIMDSGELLLRNKHGAALSCSVYARGI